MVVVSISNQQFIVNEGDRIYVPRQIKPVGKTVELTSIMTVDGEKSLLHPKNETVSGKIIEHVKAEKVLVFKKKRRKRYRRTKGHRQHLTQIEILELPKGSS